MPTPPKPNVWGPKMFKMKSLPLLPRNSFAALDRQLELWDSNKGDHRLSKFYLATVIRECKNWLLAKQPKIGMATKNNANVLKRKRAVEELMQHAFERLRWESFAAKKDVGRNTGARSLQGGYQSERTQFLTGKPKRGEFNPMGGSFVHESMESARQFAVNDPDIPQNIVVLLNKSFDALTQDEFAQLHEWFSPGHYGEVYAGMQKPHVHFARKDERIAHNMLVPLYGLFYRSDGQTPYTTADLDMYAIDQYGNLMVTPSNSVTDTTQYNHSSLNAGSDVICAGTVVIHNGLIVSIDNESGHYKPGRAQLQAALICLRDDDGTNLTNTTVKLKVPPHADQFFRGHDITSFCANVNHFGSPN